MTDLQTLRATCCHALAVYMDEAYRTCDLLTKDRIFPLLAEAKYALTEQRLRENEAYAEYQRERTKLLELASLRSVSSVN